MAAGERDPRHPGLVVVTSFACAVFVLAAIAVEVVSGQAANSPEPAGVARLVPLGWPVAARVTWWLLVAAAAAGHRVLLDRLDGRRRWVVPVLLAVPFVVFAGRVGAGASWSTWH